MMPFAAAGKTRVATCGSCTRERPDFALHCKTLSFVHLVTQTASFLFCRLRKHYTPVAAALEIPRT